MGKAIRVRTKNLHLDTGEILPATVTCAPGEPLEINFNLRASADFLLDDKMHIALGRVDPHVHFRQDVVPTREEFESDPYKPSGSTYWDIVHAIKTVNAAYDVRRGSMAALKGGVSVVGAMGNTALGPVGEARWRRMQDAYQRDSLIPIVVWPRMEPGVPAIPGTEGKDFGTTFGGGDNSPAARRERYEMWRGQNVSYHNDQPRHDISLAKFCAQMSEYGIRPELWHHLYYNNETVLDTQRATIALAREAGIASLLTRHIPSGSALSMILDERKDGGPVLKAEIGLDYFYHNTARLAAQDIDIAMINYRRPAHPTERDQIELIELVRQQLRAGDTQIFTGSDHAPHRRSAKAFRNGIPGSPGTRNIEHTTQILMHLIHTYGFSHHQVDTLASRNSAKHMEPYVGSEFPMGVMESGAMANLVVFNPDGTYTVPQDMATWLQDPEYHTAMQGERLHGRVLFTVSNGRVFDVQRHVTPLN